MCCGRVLPKATRALTGLRFSTPSAVDVADVRLWISGVEREASAVRVVGDSLLFVDLPEVVRTDSVAVEFTAKVLHNATVFAADLGQEARPDLWQSVEAAERQANLVFLPDLPGSERLIGDLQVAPSVFSPNGDGINDRVQIHFALFKAVDATPSVRIFDLAGREVVALMSSGGDVLQSFSWGGLDASGERVVPGVYVCPHRRGSRCWAGGSSAHRSRSLLRWVERYEAEKTQGLPFALGGCSSAV